MTSRLSPKVLVIAAAALAAGTAITLPALSQVAAPAAPPAQGDPAPALPLRATVLFNLLDRNGDGAIDQDEFNAFAKAIFSALDTNHDGKLDQQELGKVLAGMRGRMGGPGMRGPQGMMMGRGQAWGAPAWRGGVGPGFHQRWQEWRQHQTDNGPGPQGPNARQLGDNQGNPPVPQNFAALDTNHDGVLTPDEFAAALPGGPGGPGPVAPPTDPAAGPANGQ